MQFADALCVAAHGAFLHHVLHIREAVAAGTEEGTECKLYNGERLYDNQDLCLMLQVSKRSLQRYRTLGILPYLMLRQKTYYKESDVEKFLSEHIDCFQKEKMADYKARIR